ncbi:MAG: peptidylprolyl isomerase [Synergistaceae bacterium]|nr:peptidylprolyl isomerase [Synergistaceae bacterium]
MLEVVKDITVSDDEVKKFYDENATKLFTQPERVRASHILVSGDEELAKVQEELKSGKSFDVVAKEYSTDPGSASHGGDLGEFPRGVMVKEFEEAAFALKEPGEVSEPVKSQFGWHIIKLGERIPESVMPFEQVKAHIEQELKDKKTQDVLKERSQELEEKYKVERF